MAGAFREIVVGKIGDCLVDPMKRQFTYMCCFNRNITELETEFKDLETKRQEVQMGADDDRRNAWVVGHDVEAWLTRANAVATEVEGIIQGKAIVKEGCLNGWCPNPNLKLRYSLSRKAVKKTKVVVDLKAHDASRYRPQSYSRPPPASLEESTITAAYSDFKGLESRKLKMEEIIDALKHREINLIGVSGMGGVGKTFLVQEVAKRVKEDGLFVKVVMAAVGQKPNPTINVQARIADMLGLGRSLRDADSPIMRANLLRRRLLQDNKKVLVILDDIWKEFDLQAMGIPLDGANKNLKILYTSRTPYLWHDVRTKKEIPLELLSEDEAWQLFKEKAGSSALTFRPIATKIVNECGRLPLALVLIGSALCEKSKGNSREIDVRFIWEEMLGQLTDYASSTVGDPSWYSRLELSYENLENKEDKHLFRLCCILGKGEDIRVEDLVRYKFGLHDGMNNMANTRRQVHHIVDDLRSRYLLLYGESEDEVGECVKVHDVVRDMGAKSIPRSPMTATYDNISWVSDEIEELPEGWTFPNAEFLMLRCPKLKKLPPKFFEGMEKLKVSELRHFCGALTLQSLRNLTTLSLEGFCGTLDNVSLKGGIPNLKILNLRDSDIEELPEGIGELVNLRVLDLRDTSSLTRIPSGVISRLVLLEELYFFGSRYCWCNISCEGEGMGEEGRNANLRELELLPNLNTLEIFICGNVVIPEVPIFRELTRYKLGIKGGHNVVDDDIMDTMKEIQNEVKVKFITKSERLFAVKSSVPIPLNHGGIRSFLRSECLVLTGEGCNDLVQALLWVVVYRHKLVKYLVIARCDTPECLFDTWNLAYVVVLEVLYLRELDKLREICWGPVAENSFEVLTSIHVKGCKRLEYLFEQSLVGTNGSIVFPKLEVLKLKELPSLMGFCRDFEQIDFPQLKELYLNNIPHVNFLFRDDDSLPSNSEQNNNVGSFSVFPQKVLSPNLEVLVVSKLENLESLGHRPLAEGLFSKLKRLVVRGCPSLKNMFHPSMAESFFNLQKLVISDCLNMEGVIDEGEERQGTKMGETKLSSLVELELHSLPNLRRLCNISYYLEMPLLSKMDILGCPSMDPLSLGYVRAPSLPLAGTWWDDDVNKAKQVLEQVRTPRLEDDFQLIGLENESDLSSSELLTSSLYKLKGLTVRLCSKLLCGFPSHLLLKLHRLQELKVESCDSLEVIFELESLQSNGPNPEIFFSFKSVKLCYLPKLNCISKRGFIGLKNIQTLEICECNSLRYVFAPTMTKSIPQLRQLNISGCKMLSRIVAAENGLNEITVDEVEFPRLEKLELHNLPNLLSFFPNVNVSNNSMAKSTDYHNNNSPQSPQPLFNKKVAIPSLENLEVSGLENVSDLWCSELSTSSFSELKQLEVSNCTSLRNMFHPSMARGLVNLEKLFINNCSTLEAVVGNEGQVGDFIEVRNVDNTLFPQLANLRLNSLPNLMRFCHFTYPLKMPLVTKIDISGCPNMDAFSRGPLSHDISHAEPLAQEVSFPKLEVLQVNMLKNLERLGRGPLSMGPYSKLKELSLCNCSKLLCVFPSQLLSMLPELQKLTVERCEMLSRIVVEENELGRSSVDKVKFPQLKTLELVDLPSLFSFFSNVNVDTTAIAKPIPLFNEKVVLPSLEYLRLSRLENVSDIWCSEFQTGSFSELKQLEVSNCKSLKSIFQPSTVRVLLKLEKIYINNCSSLEAVIGQETLGGSFPLRKREKKTFHNLVTFRRSTDRVETVFPKLEKLQLRSLPNLVTFCQFTDRVEMLLSGVDILNCPNLRQFSPAGPVSAPKFSLLGTPLNGDPNNAVPFMQEHLEVGTKAEREAGAREAQPHEEASSSTSGAVLIKDVPREEVSSST